VDCGRASFLPECPDCSWRGGVRPTRLAAQAAAERHAVDVHGIRRGELTRILPPAAGA